MSESKSSRRGKHRKPERDPRLGVSALSTLLLVSGFASLVYQVLWMRHLTFLFGNGSQAAAATLAMFFAGLGAGSWWWARRVSERPLRLYAMLELGIAGSAVAYFAVRYGIQAVYPWIYGWAAGTPWMLPAKLLMAALLIFPAAFFMGGTTPAMAQVVIAQPSCFGYLSAWLYGVNTLSECVGHLALVLGLLVELGMDKGLVILTDCDVHPGVVAPVELQAIILRHEAMTSAFGPHGDRPRLVVLQKPQRGFGLAVKLAAKVAPGFSRSASRVFVYYREDHALMVQSELVEFAHQIEAILGVVRVAAEVRDPIDDDHLHPIMPLGSFLYFTNENFPAPLRLHSRKGV